MNTTSLKTTYESCTKRVQAACQRVNRDHRTVQIVAATKTQSVETIRSAISVGIRHLGENYVQELVEKAESVEDLKLSWHFIGHLQRNKVRSVLPFVDCIHSVDSIALGREISKEALRINKVVPILIQINTSAETSKSGVDPLDAEALLKDLLLLPGIVPRGLMAIPEAQDDAESTRPEFQLLASLQRELAEKCSVQTFTELSMGMSSDFEIAIEEGATLVRLGTILFGERHYD